MRLKHNRALILIAAVTLAVAVGVYRTGERVASPAALSARRAPSDRAIVVDQQSLLTAEELLRLPTTADERVFAEDALRIADNEMDLAFAAAVRRIANQPRARSDTAKEADARLQEALTALAADKAQVALLTALVAKADVAKAELLNDRLNLQVAQAALHQDEADDARQDLRRAGGDPQGRMEDMIAEHDAASRSSDSVRVVVMDARRTRGLVDHVQALQALYAKEDQLKLARAQADSLAVAFKQRHDRVAERAAARQRDSSAARLSHDSVEALVVAAQRLARDEKARAMLDQRIDNQYRLADVYSGWIGVMRVHERAAINGVLRSVLLILLIVFFSMLLTRVIEHQLDARSMRPQTSHLVARVSLQVVAVIFITLVIFGPPDNVGTMLGLAGAGLTVALKDFILGFMGWFVIVGRNGIQIGDLVEINGVTGEAVDIGMFRTELLETGHWTESGHPTGRRVSFNNSFAIEGHYFNFSASGGWLWDDVRIIVPAGRDPYAISEALKKQVDEATAASAAEVDARLRVSRGSKTPGAPTVQANVAMKPIAGGVEIMVQYVTRVTEREELRGTLYRTAVDMLGTVAEPARGDD